MLLGVDLGTSSLKAMVFDPENGRAAALERVPLQVISQAPDRAEGDPREWWDGFVSVCRALEKSRPGVLQQVRAVGIATVFPSVVPLAADGAPLGNAILYCDRRSFREVGEIDRAIGRNEFEDITGNRLIPGTCSLPGILWLKYNRPELFAKTAVFGHATTFLVHKLTGKFAVDLSHASLSGMVRKGKEGCWDLQILSACELDSDRLPELYESTAVVGEVTPEASAACGLAAGVPVAAGSGDAPSAALGGGVFGEGTIFASAGSTDCLMLAGNLPSGNPIFANAHACLPDLWISIGTMTSAGAAVRWFCEKIMHCDVGEMTALAKTVPPSPESPVFLPYLQGERTPWWNPQARGVFHGLALDTCREDLCRSVFEGVAFGWKQIQALLEEEHGVTGAQVITGGGNAKNHLWNLIKASVLERPLHVLEFGETSALGACLLAGLGNGTFPDAKNAQKSAARLLASSTVEPVPEWIEPYRQLYADYAALYPALQTTFR